MMDTLIHVAFVVMWTGLAVVSALLFGVVW